MALELTTEQRAALPRNSKIVLDWLEAKDRGDKEEAARLFSELDIPAHTLMAIKTVLGADWIRSRNLRTHLAEEKYGPDWLDAPEGEPVAGAKSAG